MGTSYILRDNIARVTHISVCPVITGTDSLLFWLIFSRMFAQQIALEDKNSVSIWNIYIFSILGKIWTDGQVWLQPIIKDCRFYAQD